MVNLWDLRLLKDYKKNTERLSTKICSDRRKGRGFKLKDSRFRLDIRKNPFTMRVGIQWDRLSRKTVDVLWMYFQLWIGSVQGQAGWDFMQPNLVS